MDELHWGRRKRLRCVKAIRSSSVSFEAETKSGIELEDKISSLPDSILVHILSFLPTRDAVKTILISRFGQLWTSTNNIEFDRCSYHDCANVDYENGDDKCLKFIRHALILHERPTIDKFCLNFAFSFTRDWDKKELQEIQYDEDYIREMKLASEIDTWMGFAMMRDVKILNVDLMACENIQHECCYKLPNFVLSSCHLTELRLVGCALNPGGQVQLKSLKILSFFMIKLNDELMDTILSGCPLLEDLYLLRCPGLHKLNFTSPCSKMLNIFVLDDEESKLEISCPTVTSLNVSGWLEHVELKNVSSVVHAAFNFSYRFSGFKNDYLEIVRLFMKLHHAKALKICTWCVLVFSVWKVTNNISCPSFHWKSLVLETVMNKRHLHGIAYLLRSFPHLEALSINVWSGVSSSTHFPGLWLDAYELDEENYWNLQPFDCLSNHLKTVNICGKIIYSKYVIQLVKFLLKSSMVLEKLVIHAKHDGKPQWAERLLKFTQKLASFPRASNRAVILFI